MTQTLKKGAGLLIAGFLVFYLLTQPVEFAGVVRSLGSWLDTGFHGLIRFFNALTQ